MPKSKNKDLKNFVDSVAKKSHLRVDKDLGAGFYRLRSAEAQRRQAQQDVRCVEDAVIELLRNSRDASAKNIFLAINTEENYRHILVIDDGDGVPKTHHETIFEPYVTSKLDSMKEDEWGVHGRGMALYSIAQNSLEAKIINSESNIGTSIFVKCNTKKLNEKRDQSSFPDFYVNDDQELVVRGPKNILRTACEFAFSYRSSGNVYVGSPVEIAATLYNSGKAGVKAVFSEPDEKTRLVDLLSFSSDVHDFKKYAACLGIHLSKRTARRIMDGDIPPQASLLERIAAHGIFGKSESLDPLDIKGIYRAKPKKQGVKLDVSDREILASSIEKSFSEIAPKYYLEPDVDSKVSIKGNKVTISFEVTESVS